MTHGADHDHHDGVITRAVVSLPLVSVIVINYNYGRFLTEAVASVLGQTYPRVECVIVDNASTDESPSVLDSLDRRYPDLVTVRRASNAGQTGAALDGLAASRGAYVIFLDADDVLLPNCVDAHVYAHLSLRMHVGFTSGDMLQVAEGQIVVATGEDFNRYVRSGKGRRSDLVRPYAAAATGAAANSWPSAATAARLVDAIHIVAPLHTSWIWSPTSGSCYRRDALTMFADNPKLADLRTGTDMYFGLAIGALTGSALIDEPVFAYRIHGNNIYTQGAQLDRTLCFKPGSSGDSNAQARLLIIDHLVARADRFAPTFWLGLNLVLLLIILDQPDRDPSLRRWQRRSRLAQRLVDDPDTISATLGPWLMAFLKLYSGAPFRRR